MTKAGYKTQIIQPTNEVRTNPFRNKKVTFLFFPSRSQQATSEKEKRTFNLSNSESMSLHAFERRCVFYARLGRLVEPLIADCGFTGDGTVTWFSTVLTSSHEGFDLVHASKICP